MVMAFSECAEVQPHERYFVKDKDLTPKSTLLKELDNTSQRNYSNYIRSQ